MWTSSTEARRYGWGLSYARLRLAKAKLRRAKVELEGLEPSSKQIAEVLSTCLAGYWLSDKARKSAPKPCLISLILSYRRSVGTTSPKLRALCDPVGIRHLRRQNVLSRFLEAGLSHYPFNRLGSKSEVIFASCLFSDDIYERI